jgi:hypothetical protein
VTDDGAETDLDLGHYERFLNVPAHENAQRHREPLSRYGHSQTPD